MFYIKIIPENLVNPVVSATAIIAGSLIGGICSWITTSYATRKNIEVENKIVEENRKYDTQSKTGEICGNINIIQLDICNAIFQSIRTLKYCENKEVVKYPIPINREYSKVIASLTCRFNLREMSYIYQLYGIIEVLNKHIKEYNSNAECAKLIKKNCELFLKKLYGDNYLKVLDMDIEKITYRELFQNNLIKDGYKNVLDKLDKNSCIEKYKQYKE